jgi:hypothetical protein
MTSIPKTSSEQTTCCSLPSPPKSVCSFVGNRFWAITKTVVSLGTCLGNAITSPLCCGDREARKKRAAFSLATTFQGIRQFFYLADREDTTFGNKMKALAVIANIPCSDNAFERNGVLRTDVIQTAWARILCPNYAMKENLATDNEPGYGTSGVTPYVAGDEYQISIGSDSGSDSEEN